MRKWGGLPIIKLLIMQYSLIPCYFLTLRPNIFFVTLLSDDLAMFLLLM